MSEKEKNKILITPVGISILHNYLSSPYSKRYDIRKNFKSIENEPISRMQSFETDILRIKQLPEDFFLKLEKKDDKWLTKENIFFKASAEIYSIKKFYDLYVFDDEKLKVFLICTDTISSWLSAYLIVRFFFLDKVRQNYNIEFYKLVNITEKNFREQIITPDNFDVNYIPELKVININHKTLADKTFELINLILKIKNNRKNVFLNITGGYKALTPILSIIGQLEELKLFYLYEDSETDILLPQFPISIDWQYLDLYSLVLKNLDNDEIFREFPEIEQDLLDLYLIEKNKGKRILTPFGRLFKNYADNYQTGRSGVLFGHFMELLFKDLLSVEDEYKNVQVSQVFWLDLQNKECYKEPKYNKDSEKEKRIEIDFVTDTFWAEIKPLSNINKAFKQIKSYLICARSKYVKEELNIQIKALGLLLYHYKFDKLKESKIKEIDNWAISNNIDVKIYLFELPLKDGRLDINRLTNISRNKIEIKTQQKLTKTIIYKIEY